MNVPLSCVFTFLWAKNFHIANTAIKMRLSGIMRKKNEGFPELSRNRLKECQGWFFRNVSVCCTEHCLQVMSSELFSWQVICRTATMSSIIACTSWWWNILAFFEKKYGVLLCREREVPELQSLRQEQWNIKSSSESLSHSWLCPSPTSAWGRAADGRDLGTNCRKMSYQCQWCRKERWGKRLITIIEGPK